MNDSHDAIHRIIEAFERSDWSEIDIRSGDLHVHLAADRHGAPSRPASPVDAALPAAAAQERVAAAALADSPFEVGHDIPLDGAHIVESPSPGIFWSSPAPGEPPFAAVGDLVDPATTLCIVEVMKLMSHLKAGITGEIVAVYGRNGERVQKGEALFAIAPTGSAT